MRFQNAPFLSRLLDILQHPVAADQPDLLHFRPADDAGTSDLGPPASSGAAQAAQPAEDVASSLWLLVALLAGLVVAGGAALQTAGGRALRRRVAVAAQLRPRMPHVPLPHVELPHPHLCAVHARPALHRLHLWWRARRHLVGLPLGALTLTAAAVVTAAGAAVARHGVPTHSAPIAGVGLTTQAPSAAAATDAQPEAPQAWIELVGIERGISGAQDKLAQQETAIAGLARVVAAHHPDPDSLSPTTGGAAILDATNALTALVAAHDATKAALQQSLAAEYTLYRAAAADPQKRAQLIEAAAGAKAPAIAQAVTYNLSQVDTQLSQEAAIAAAEKKLGSFSGLSAAQLEAIRRGQPFIAPEAGAVVQGFGPTDLGFEPPYTYHGTFFPHFHTGVDIAAPLGTPIHAAADGVVALAATSVDAQGKPAGYGTYVVIAHPGGFFTLYAHMDGVAVAAGQVVRQGQVIGVEGSTGNSTGPHVHFEIRHGNDLVDPATLLKGQLHS